MVSPHLSFLVNVTLVIFGCVCFTIITMEFLLL